MAKPGPDLPTSVGARPGGRASRVRASILAAALDLLTEKGYEGMEIPEVARRAGVHPTTVYRRWAGKARLAGEALLENGRPLSRAPDTGGLRTDLERVLIEGWALLHTRPVRALFEVLLGEWTHPSAEIARARDRFWTAHLEEVREVVARAVARSELPAETDPAALVELLIGSALVRALLVGGDLGPAESAQIVGRTLAALGGGYPAPGSSNPT